MISPRLNDFVFFGTDEFAVGVLEALVTFNYRPALIITTSDKPRGRKLALVPPAVKLWAEENKISYLQPENLRSLRSDLETSLRSDLGLVASYGQLIPPTILNLPKYGTLNIHPSLLPKYRGPTPIQSAILAGEEQTGVTIILIDEQIDHGPILQTTSYKLQAKSYFEARNDLARLGARSLVEILPAWLAGKIIPIPQNHAQATYTKKIKKEDGLIDLAGDPRLNYRKFLAFNPWPGTFFFVERNGKKVRVIVSAGHFENDQFILDRVKPEGKKEMAWADFRRGFKPKK